MKWSVLLASLLVVPVFAASGMHGNNEHSCELYGNPYDHAVDDGHEHYHHLHATALGHNHGGVWHEAGHEHGSHGHGGHGGMAMGHGNHAGPEHMVAHHDVCDQTGREHIFAPVDPVAPAISPAGFTYVDRIHIWNDAGLAQFPGSGTPEDPYVIERYWIEGNLDISDTSKCIVLRDNVIGYERRSTVIDGDVIPEPDWSLIPDDPRDQVDWPTRPSFNALIAETFGTWDTTHFQVRQLTDQASPITARLMESVYDPLYDPVRASLNQIVFDADDMIYGPVDTAYAATDKVPWSMPKELAQDLWSRIELGALAEVPTEPASVGQLVLDWNGDCVHAYHNLIADLRVNQNNHRLGHATGGLLESNVIQYIGQIRHYDGEFRSNIVGPKYRTEVYRPVTHATTAEDDNQHARLVNGDGFNQGWMHHNVFYGSIDLDYHGHHHGAGFFAPHSHYHGNDPFQKYLYDANGTLLLDRFGNPETHHNHSRRWTSAAFTDNIVWDPAGYGLRYEDRNHAGDDTVANSEQVASLAYPHRHQSWILLERNGIVGHLMVDVFNADQGKRVINGTAYDIHPERNDGWLDILRNDIVLNERPDIWYHFGNLGNNAVALYSMKEMEMRFENNSVSYVAANSDQDLTALLYQDMPDQDPTDLLYQDMPDTDPCGILCYDPEPLLPTILAAINGASDDDNAAVEGVEDELDRQRYDWSKGLVIVSVRDGHMDIERNSIIGFHTGLFAASFDQDTTWRYANNVVLAHGDEEWTWSISNPPDRDPLP